MGKYTVTPGGGRRVVIFRTLSFQNLAAALGFRAVGLHVIFIEPVGLLRSEAAVAHLTRLGIKWVDYHAYDGFRVNADIAVSARYAEALVAGQAFRLVLETLCARVPGLAGNPQRARALLFDRLASGLAPAAAAYALAEHLRNQGIKADVFHPGTPVETLIAAEDVTKVRNLFPGWLAFLGRAAALGRTAALALLRRAARSVTRVAFRGDTMAATSRVNAAPTAETVNTPAVLLFPHKGLAYGNLLVKDQYFSSDPDSPFHPSRMKMIELSWMLSADTRKSIAADYRRRGISVTFLERSPVSLKEKMSCVAFYLFRESGPRKAWAHALILAQLETQVRACRESFQPFAGAALALIDSDNLFPRVATVALQSLNITVAALQERFMSAQHEAFVPLFDVLFVHGDAVRRRIAANPNASVGRLVVTGDPNVAKIGDNRVTAQAERKKRFADFTHVCLVLDFHSPENIFADALSYGPDQRSNLDFYRVVTDLAAAEPDCAFIIRGKDNSWMSLPAMAAAHRRCEELTNVFVDGEYSRIDRSYVLAAMADIVIARYTSLCDQCLAAGIPVLIYDALPNGDKLISPWHDYAPYPVVVYDAETLRVRFIEIVREGRFMAPDMFDAMRRDYYNVGGPDPRQRLHSELEVVYGSANRMPDAISGCLGV